MGKISILIIMNLKMRCTCFPRAKEMFTSYQMGTLSRPGVEELKGSCCLYAWNQMIEKAAKVLSSFFLNTCKTCFDENHLRQLQRAFWIISKLLCNGMTIKSKSLPLLLKYNKRYTDQKRFKSLWDVSQRLSVGICMYSYIKEVK